MWVDMDHKGEILRIFMVFFINKIEDCFSTFVDCIFIKLITIFLKHSKIFIDLQKNFSKLRNLLKRNWTLFGTLKNISGLSQYLFQNIFGGFQNCLRIFLAIL